MASIQDIFSGLPNFFGSTPEAYRGLLTPEQSAGLEKRANIGGLLGFAGALAQGMSPQGYRRSALQNILSAAGAGYGAAGQTFDAGLNQLANVQKLQQSQAQITAINQLLQVPEIANDPMMVAYIRANPGEAIKYFAEMAPLQRAISGGTPASSVTPVTPVAPSVVPSPVAAPSGVSSAAPVSTFRGITAGEQVGDIGFTLGKDGQLESMAGGLTSGLAPSRMGLTSGGVGLTGRGDMLPTVSAPEVAPETTALPGVTVQGQPSPILGFENQKTELMARINELRGVNQRLSTVPTKQATDIRTANNSEITNLQNQIKALDEQIGRTSVASYDFQAIEELVPKQFKGRVASLRQAAETGTLTMDQLTQRLQAIEKDASEFVTKKTDYTNQDRRVAAGMFNGRAIEDLNPTELMQLQNELDKRDIQKRRAGAIVIDMGSREMEKEFAKGVVEDTRASFQQAKSALGTIKSINTLKPILSAGVYEGVLAGAPRAIDQFATALGVSGKNTQEKLQRTAVAMQRLASLELQAAEAMKNQGAITENERALIARAAGGNLRDFTATEIQSLLNALDTVARAKVEAHQANWQVMSEDPIGRKYSKYYKIGEVPPPAQEAPVQQSAPSGVTVRKVR